MGMTLYKRELSSFFYNYSAYFILAFYMFFSLSVAFFAGMYFVVDNPSMRSYFEFQPLIQALVLPAAAVRLWSDEAKNGTQEVLLTLPVKSSTVVGSKFAAGFSLSLLMLLTVLPLIFLTGRIIAVDPLNIASAFLGSVLSAAVLMALGCAVSCLIPLPSVAYLASAVLGIILISFKAAPFVAPLATALPDAPFYLPEALDFWERYQGFVNGYFGLDAIFYFVSLMLTFLIFNWVVLYQKRRGR